MWEAVVESDETRAEDRTPSKDAGGGDPGAPPQNPHGVLLWLMTLLERYVNHEIDDEQLMTALRTVGRYAAESRILPEKVIVSLKAAWAQVIPTAGRAVRWMDDRLLERLVTACLDGYYGS
jgi:hypothetical protein